MENLNAEQVKKALECCKGDDLSLCRQCEYHIPSDPICIVKMAADALALINSQEQRIKELAEENERLRASSIDYRNIPYIKAEAKADTVRKMQERLNKRFGRDKNRVHTDYNVHRYIDQIAKEILEGIQG